MNALKTLAASAAVLALAGTAPALSAQTVSNPSTVTLAPIYMGPATERHPEIRSAIAALRRAVAHMQAANHDFGGHRVDAIKASEAAIVQLRLALAYDHK